MVRRKVNKRKDAKIVKDKGRASKYRLREAKKLKKKIVVLGAILIVEFLLFVGILPVFNK